MTTKMLIGMVALFVGFGLAYNARKPDVNSGEYWQGAPNYTQRVSDPWPHPTPALYASPAGRRQGPTLPRPPEMASQRKEHFPPRPPECARFVEATGEYANKRFVEQADLSKVVSSDSVIEAAARINDKLPLVTE